MIDELADLLLGSCCPGCGAPGLGLCPPCRAALPCGAEQVVDAAALGGLPVWAAGRHAGVLRELVSAHKDRGSWQLVGTLADLALPGLDQVLARAGAGPVVLVPVPSSSASVRQRGRDHTLALARSLQRRRPGARARPLLRRVRRVADQAGLGRAQRCRNQAGSMRALPPGRSRGGTRSGARVVLVDDVCTTGATLAEAARALRAAGWPVLGAVVVAHPSRPAESRQGTP